MDEREKQLLRKQEDIRFVQGCVFVTLALILEFFLFQVKDKYYALTGTLDQAFFLEDMFHMGRWVGLGIFVLGLVYILYSFVTGKGDVFYPFATTAVGFVLMASCFGISIYGAKGVGVLLFLVPAWAGLAVIFCLYQVEFFISGYFTSLGGVTLWLCGQVDFDTMELSDPKRIVYYLSLGTSLVLILIGFFLVNKAYGNGGSIRILRQELTLISDMKDSSSLWLLGLSAIMSFLTIAVAVTFGFQVIYYCTMALLAWLFILLIYYTVKMM